MNFQTCSWTVKDRTCHKQKQVFLFVLYESPPYCFMSSHDLSNMSMNSQYVSRTLKNMNLQDLANYPLNLHELSKVCKHVHVFSIAFERLHCDRRHHRACLNHVEAQPIMVKTTSMCVGTSIVHGRAWNDMSSTHTLQIHHNNIVSYGARSSVMNLIKDR